MIVKYILGILLYLIVVYILSRNLESHDKLMIFSTISVVGFTLLKYIGHFYNILYLQSVDFYSSLFIVITIILYLPVIYSFFKLISNYVRKKTDNKWIFILALVLFTILFIVFYMTIGIIYWYLLFNYM